jgi:membrane-bound inhibitor of C-type lysozyme
MPSRSRLMLVLCTVCLASAARADNRASFSCEDGHKFTITFLAAHNNQFAHLLFAGSKHPVKMKNQGMASGIAYAGGGFEYREWQGKCTLVDARSAKPKETACAPN